MARSVVGVAKAFGISFMGLAGTAHQIAAKELGVNFIAGLYILIFLFNLGIAHKLEGWLYPNCICMICIAGGSGFSLQNGLPIWTTVQKGS